MSSGMRFYFYIYTLLVVVIALVIGYFIGHGILKFDPVFLLVVFGFLATFAMRMLVLHLISSADDHEL